MPGERPISRPIFLLILALLLLSFALYWWRWNMVPAVAGYDEVMINDAALGVASFGEMRAPHLEGTPLGSIYALHPPGYLLLQGAIIRAFGLTPLTLRISAKLARMGVGILGLLILRLLWRRGVLSGAAAVAVAILWLFDLASFWIGRQARMESMEEMLALGAAWILLRQPEQRRSWWIAAVLLGLTATMHASAVLFWFVFLVGLWFFRQRLGGTQSAVLAALPIAIAGVTWLAVHRERAWEAWALFRLLNSYRNDIGLAFGFWAPAALRRSLNTTLIVGGPTYWVVVGGWLAAIFQIRAARTNRWVAFAIACAVGHAAFAQFLTGMLAQRVVLYVPCALLAIGLALTRLPPGRQRIALGLAALFGVVQCTAMIYYAHTPGDRSIDRFDAMNLPGNVRTVAGGTELWYYFVTRNRPFRLIITERPAYGDYWRLHPEHFNDWDAVILNPADPVLQWPVMRARRKLYFQDFAGTLVICLRGEAPRPATDTPTTQTLPPGSRTP